MSVCDRSCQVYVRSMDDEEFGWWPGKVTMIKGELAAVECRSWDSTFSDIVPLERIRPICTT